MREPFDNWWKHQLEGFNLEPDPGDWEAIHRRLHPRRRRRAGFWLFPLLGVLLLGGGFALFRFLPQQTAENLTITENVVLENSPEKYAEPARDQQGAAGKKPVGEDAAPTGATVVTAPTMPQPTVAPIAQEYDAIPAAHQLKAITAASGVPLNQPAASMNPAGETPTATAHARADTPTIMEKTATPTTGNPSQIAPEAEQVVAATVATTETPKMAGSDSATADDGTGLMAGAPVALRADSLTGVSSGRSRRRGQLWASVAVGGIWPQSAPLLQPGRAEASADFTINPGSGSTILRNTLLGQSGGPTLQAAAHWQIPLGKRLQLSVGAGMQYGRWHQESLWFSDSILPGGVMAGSRLAATGRMTMQWWSLQVPIYLQGSFGKKGLGWVAGMQNLLTLNLRQQERLDGLTPSTGSTNNQVLTDRITTTNLTSGVARTYVPQLAAGLSYQHRGRLAWRLQPMVYLPLSNLYLSGSSRGKAYPLQAGLGWQVPLR